MSHLSRRQFLVAGGALVAGATCMGRLPVWADAYPDAVRAAINRFHGFKMGIQSFSLRHFSLEQTIEHAANLGLHWIEFFPGHYGVSHDQARIDEVAAMLSPHDISLSVHGVHGFNDDEGHNRRLFEFAKLAGIPVLSADPTPASFPILHDLVQEYDIKIGIHNHGPGHRYDRVEDSLEAVADYDERIGFCPDTGHYMRSGEDPVEMVHQLKDRLYGMHLKDHDGIHREGPPETILGEGAMDLQAICQAMREVDFKGPISLEYELNPANPIDDIQKGLDNFIEAAKATA